MRVTSSALVFTLAACTGPGGDHAERPGERPTNTAARPPQFGDFPAGARFTGRPAAVDLVSDTAAGRFRTRLRWSEGDTVDFAGRYRLVLWGCGTSCQSGALVD